MLEMHSASDIAAAARALVDFATDLMRSRDKSAITPTIHLLRSPLGVHCNPRRNQAAPRVAKRFS